MDYLDINRLAWDKRTKIHVKSKFYDVDGFLQGKSSLNSIELKQLGNVEGKSLLHLQCHFGQDTLSWARLGARVTGVDLSTEAITQAKSLSAQMGIDAVFVNDDVVQFGNTNTEQFDIVFTSYGAIGWLPNMTEWAETVAKSLKVGGEFHLVEFHLFNDLLSGYSYFPSTQPDIEEDGTYTENCDGEKNTMATWSHPLSEVIGALISAGTTIEAFHEYPYCPYNCFEGLEFVAGQGYQLRHKGQQVPLIYSIKGRKMAL